jgi:glycosyltransferase involved in cell wall biosynthesis
MMSAASLAIPRALPLPPAERRFNIAVFSYGLPRPGHKRSGIEQVAHDLANALVARGHSVTVFSYDPPPPTATYVTGTLPAGRFATSRVGRALSMGYLGNLFALGPDYRSFDVIVAHGDSLLLPFTGKPVVRIMHGCAWEEARAATSISRAVLQAGVYVQELATALLQPSTVGVSANTRRLNPFVRHVIPNGIDLTLFKPDAEARSVRPSILFVGALQGRKRGSWLIEQFTRAVRPLFPDAELHMVTVAGPAVPGVTYHIGVTPDILRALYQSAWAYASPSTYEGFGLPYVEALASGLPIVATPNPGSLEILENGRFGRIVSDDEFAPALCQLLREPAERARMSALGIRRAAAYDVNQTAAQYESIIGRMVACHG